MMQKKPEMLFPDCKRDIEIGPHTMSHYEFTSRCSRSDCVKVRDVLEEWFARYPKQNKNELKANFQNDFSAAFWELYIHELLIRLGYNVCVHPDLPHINTKPDFLAKDSTGNGIFVEAVAPNVKMQEGGAAANRKKDFLDYLNKLNHPDFYLKLDESGWPATSSRQSSVRRKLKNWLDSLNYDQCLNLLEQHNFKVLPQKSFHLDGWDLLFYAIPKPVEKRGEFYGPAIHFHLKNFQGIDPLTPIRNAIQGKTSKYGSLQSPFVVAVNAVGVFAKAIETGAGLFAEKVSIPIIGRGSDIQREQRQSPDCIWLNRNGKKNTHVSAVLLGLNVNPWLIASTNLSLYHSPWAKHPCQGHITSLPEYETKDTMLTNKEGVHPRSIFGLSPNWPFTN